MKTHIVKLDNGEKRVFNLVPVSRECKDVHAKCTGCFFFKDSCEYPTYGNSAPKCLGSAHADCQDRIYKEKV